MSQGKRKYKACRGCCDREADNLVNFCHREGENNGFTRVFVTEMYQISRNSFTRGSLNPLNTLAL